MEGARRKVILGLGISVLVLLSVLLIILIFTDRDKKKKKDDTQGDEASVEIPKFLLSEITRLRKGRDTTEETLHFEYDEFGRCTTITYKTTEEEDYQLTYHFSYWYEDGEPYTSAYYDSSRSGDYRVTWTYDSGGTLRKEETAVVNGDNPGEKTVLETVLYNDRGDELQRIEYNYSGIILSADERTYDAYGHTIRWVKKKYQNGEETVLVLLEGECDEKGRVVRYYDVDEGFLRTEIAYYDDGSRYEEDYARDGGKISEGYYDSEGRKLKNYMYDAGELSRTIEYEYHDTEYGYMKTETVTYCSEGIVRKFDTEYDLKDKILYQKDYTNGSEEYVVRDDAGRIISEERRTATGRITKVQTYEYDGEGNLISKKDDNTKSTYKYAPVSLTAEQAKEREKFYFDEEICRGLY